MILEKPVSLPIERRLSADALDPSFAGGLGSVSFASLSPSSTSTDAAVGTVIGSLSMRAFRLPRLSSSTITTDAAIGSLIGTLSI